MIAGHTVMRPKRSANPLVVDCGAHKGEFSRGVHERWGAVGHAIEASPLMHAQLTLPPSFESHHFAVSDTNGETAFHISTNPEFSRIQEEGASTPGSEVRVASRSLSSFLEDIDNPVIDILKLDIEGAEVRALDSLSDAQLQRIVQITVEFHDFCGQITSAEVDRVVSRLLAVGFFMVCFSFSTRGDVLFVNNRLQPLSFTDRLIIIWVQRFLLGIKRRIERSALYRMSRPSALRAG
jgi:FkbM family methyltransferase